MEYQVNPWGRERGLHLYNIADKGQRMIAERINLEIMDLSLNDLPLCTEEEAVYIEEFIPRAKEGFALTLKADTISPLELLQIFRKTSPKTISGIWREIRLSDRQNTLPEYGHTLATLALLLEMGRVAFYDFPSLSEDVGYSIGTTSTFWYMLNPTAGEIWNKLSDLETIIRDALYKKEPIGENDLLTIGHFFSAGKEVAKIFT